MFHSVRSRLTLWYTAILGLVLITFGGICYLLLAREIRAATDDSIADTGREFAAAFSNDPTGVKLDFRFSDRSIIVFSSKGEIVASTRILMNAVERRRLVAEVRRGLNGFATIPGAPGEDGVRVFALPITVIGQRYTVVVARPLEEQSDRLESAASSVFLGIPLALMVAAAGGYLLAKKSLQPVTTMSAKARQIGAATLTERIAVENERDELGFLASTLNDLLERLQRAFDSQKHFMADASHELRTPLSIIQGEADVALARRDRSAEEYRQSVEVMQKAALKLTRIVQNLFLLARTDAGTYPMNCSRFYLDELIAESVRSMRSVAAAREVELSAASDSDLLIVADEELINRMLLNLVENALKFTAPGGWVRVEVRRRERTYDIRVSDNGEGVAEADRGRIFDRFFRGDRIRQSRGAGGAGLGLPIARWIDEARGGRLVVERSTAEGIAWPPGFAGKRKPATAYVT